MRRSFQLITIAFFTLFLISATQEQPSKTLKQDEAAMLRANILRTAPASSESFLYSRWTPGVVYGDESSSTKLEVWTKGSIKSIKLSSGSNLYGNLNDDGVDGDRQANDNIWTIEGITKRAYSYWFPGYTTYGFDVEIVLKDGTSESHWLSSLGIAEKTNYEAKKVRKDFWATRYAAFLVDKKGELLDGKIPICESVDR